MTRQNIGIGSSANDGNGDTLRTAGSKINANFREIYTFLADSNNLSTQISLENDAVVFEGSSTDDFETRLKVTDPTKDNIITLPDSTGTVTLDNTIQTLTNKTLTAPNINAATFSGILGGAIIGGIDAATGGGSSVALTTTTLISEITTSGAQAFSLANGTVGQIKIITMVVDGGDATLTPATLSGGSTIVFNDVGDSVILVYHNTIGWKAIMNNGTTIS